MRVETGRSSGLPEVSGSWEEFWTSRREWKLGGVLFDFRSKMPKTEGGLGKRKERGRFGIGREAESFLIRM